MPVEQHTKAELVINLKTTERSPSRFPQSILLRADEVIQRRLSRMTASMYGRYDRLWLDSYGQASIAGLLRYASRFILPRFRIGTITETQSTANFSCNDANGALKISLLHESALEQRIHCKCGNSVGPVSLIHMEYRLVSTIDLTRV